MQFNHMLSDITHVWKENERGVIIKTQLEQLYISVPFTCIHVKQNVFAHRNIYK